MKYTSAWRDFEIIATGDGEKLERWGNVILLRPDPQAIWKPSLDYATYPQISGHYLRSSTGGGSWQWLKPTPDEWTIKYKNLSFIISPMNFKHTGLFPEQAVNWDMVMDVISKHPQAKVLNLFAYTGGATVACAKAGAVVTHVDASRGMTDVAKRNVALNQIPYESVRYIVDDCQKFVAREIRRGRKYDAIIMDPPNFGRGANGEVWKLTENLDDLIANCVQLLSDHPLFILVNNYTASVQPAVIENVLRKNLDGLHYQIQTYEIGLPTKEKLVLPCGGASYVSFL